MGTFPKAQDRVRSTLSFHIWRFWGLKFAHFHFAVGLFTFARQKCKACEKSWQKTAACSSSNVSLAQQLRWQQQNLHIAKNKKVN